METDLQTSVKEVPKANVTWVEKYRPGALQDLISHEGRKTLVKHRSKIDILAF